MSAGKLKFAIFGNEYQQRKSTSIDALLASLSRHGGEAYMERSFHEFLTRHLGKQVSVAGLFTGGEFDADYAVSIGGDGTFLKAASIVGPMGVPIMGINTGRLGFLADVLPSEIEDAIYAIFANNFDMEMRTVLKVETSGVELNGSPYALNDVSILKRDTASMITIRASVDGVYFVTYQADGLLVCTPTGSTAYNLSNGGPIMVPASTGCICLTPIAPHSLNMRSLVMSDRSVLTFEVLSRSHNFLIGIDGRSEKLAEGTKITIRRAPYRIHLIKTGDHRYFSTLREKLMWGADNRQ